MFRKSLLLGCRFQNWRNYKIKVNAMKYILVTGGVISGIGKGVIASSIGKILKSRGHEVTAIKIDPYINIDAGTFSPYEHGEVFVLDDGGEVDLDLGNYERFLDIKLNSDNNITTGKIYQSVINKERRGDFLGKTVQVVPHITDAIQDWVERVSLIPVNENAVPEVCIIELGGTIGDIEGMSFVEAFRQFQFRVKRQNFCCVHVSLVPQPKSTGEHKSKPTQASVRELRGLGLSPDLIVCRSENPITEPVKNKISNFCHVPPEQEHQLCKIDITFNAESFQDIRIGDKKVICLHDVKSVYNVPMFLENQNLCEFFHDRLNLPVKLLSRRLTLQWQNLTNKIDRVAKTVTIALVGKYTSLEDAYASVMKALEHASLHCNLKLKLKLIASTSLENETKCTDPLTYYEAWKTLCQADGVIVPGGFGKKGIEGKILAINWAREKNKPFLGICMGFQCAVIELARSKLELWDANSTEMNPETTHKLVIDMPEHNTGNMGGTMRLGKKTTIFNTEDSVLWQLYGKSKTVDERHRHRYEVNKEYVNDLEANGMRFVGQDETGDRLEILELKDHPFFVAVQYHPEYISTLLRPSPPYLGLILASTKKLTSYLSRGCRFSPRNISEDELSEEDFDVKQLENISIKE